MKKMQLALILLLSGCAVGPNYRTPENTVSATWAEKPEDTDAPLIKWWEVFDDELLNKYIKTDNNTQKNFQTNFIEIKRI